MALLGAVGCTSNNVPVQPPGRPPTPKSVTLANPGGDAADPELAALERLANLRWGNRRDRFNTLTVPLIDWPHWQRVRLWGYPTRAAYRYGDEHYAVVGIWYTPVDGDNDPETCLKKFLGEATPVAEAYGVHVTDTKVHNIEQIIDGEQRPVVVKTMDGSLDTLVENNDYVGGLASYQSWPGTCLFQGFAVIATKHRDLALKIRDRWLKEMGVTRLAWLKHITEAPPTLSR
jgi:hypothetical protein